jgi:hypothetical protein
MFVRFEVVMAVTAKSTNNSCCMARPSHYPWLDNSNDTWWTVQVMKPLVMQFSPASYHTSRSRIYKFSIFRGRQGLIVAYEKKRRIKYDMLYIFTYTIALSCLRVAHLAERSIFPAYPCIIRRCLVVNVSKFRVVYGPDDISWASMKGFPLNHGLLD